MNQRGLILPTLFTFLVTGFVLVQAGWFAGPRPPRGNLPRRVEPPSPGSPCDLASIEALQRWRGAPPQHWRACLLQK